jgi:dihydrofolate reductase
MIVSIIAAIDPSNGLGYKNTLPWHIPEDFKLFKQKTLGHTMLMGGNTFRSIGKALPGRHTVVLTKEVIKMNNAHTIKSLDELWEDDCLLYEDELFICGGAQIYNMFIKIADKLYLSHIHTNYICDTFFPDYSNYKVVSETEYNINTINHFKFKEYINEKNI